MPGAHGNGPSLPPSNGHRGGKQNKRLAGQDKEREITHQLPSWAKQTRLGEINLLTVKSV